MILIRFLLIIGNNEKQGIYYYSIVVCRYSELRFQAKESIGGRRRRL